MIWLAFEPIWINRWCNKLMECSLTPFPEKNFSDTSFLCFKQLNWNVFWCSPPFCSNSSSLATNMFQCSCFFYKITQHLYSRGIRLIHTSGRLGALWSPAGSFGTPPKGSVVRGPSLGIYFYIGYFQIHF